MEKDLGVLVDSQLNMNQHVPRRPRKPMASRPVSNTVASRTREVIIPMYLALLRMHLESCVQFWGPHSKKDIEVLE